jgi:hypothetical protein
VDLAQRGVRHPRKGRGHDEIAVVHDVYQPPEAGGGERSRRP